MGFPKRHSFFEWIVTSLRQGGVVIEKNYRAVKAAESDGWMGQTCSQRITSTASSDMKYESIVSSMLDTGNPGSSQKDCTAASSSASLGIASLTCDINRRLRSFQASGLWLKFDDDCQKLLQRTVESNISPNMPRCSKVPQVSNPDNGIPLGWIIMEHATSSWIRKQVLEIFGYHVFRRLN